MEKIIALYERLSREDENLGESYSISNQKKLLEDYCREKGWTRFRHFSDDGISGTTFERPEFKAMMQLVDDNEISTIIIKDMSRLGRDYLVVGQLRELFRQRGVRLIAINDNHDSKNGDDDFLVFRDVMNEMYAKDISKKIRSTFKSKGNSGKHVASSAPYGYLKDKDDGNHWIVDEEAAQVVRQIFQWTIEGIGPYQISRLLREAKVEIPAVHMARHGQGLNKNKTFKDPYNWGSSTIVHILGKMEYLGHTVNFKTAKHFKDKKSHYVSRDNWVVFENTQEPIITQEQYDLVQKIRANVRRYPDGWGEHHVLTGLMRCADCGAKMYVHRTSNGKRIPQYTCSAYSKVPVGTLCNTQHRINESVVLELIGDMLKAIFEYAKYDRNEFIDTITTAQSTQEDTEVKRVRARITVAKNRCEELEKLICRIYEDNILGKLPDSRYEVLDKQYSKEKVELDAEIKELDAKLIEYEKGRNSASKFMALIDKYEKFEELTPAMINECNRNTGTEKIKRRGVGISMNVFAVVKDNVTAKQVAMQYGIKINRSGLACCPFHKDKTPSMKLDKRYYCFGCGDTGDAIDFVAKYFGLAPKEAAMKIASDFGLNYDATNRAPPKRTVPKKTPEQILDEEQKQCFRELSDYYHLLKEWKIKYAPKSMDEEWHPRFVEALQNISKVEYQLDTLLEKDIPDRAFVVSDIGKGGEVCCAKN